MVLTALVVAGLVLGEIWGVWSSLGLLVVAAGVAWLTLIGGRLVRRIAAALALVAVLAILAGGVVVQRARDRPFDPPPDWSSWLVTPTTDPGHYVMPVVPVGRDGRFLPRGLCSADPDATCPALQIFPDGRARLTSVEGRLPPFVARVTYLGQPRHLFAIGLDGVLYRLVDDGKAWSATSADLPVVTQSGEPVVLRGHEGLVRSAMFSPDRRRVVTASEDGTARIWAADGTSSPVVLRGHDGPVSSAAFSPDEMRVVTGSSDSTARIWAAAGTGSPVILRGHDGPVSSAAFSPDGMRVVTASHDGTTRTWTSDGTGPLVVLRSGDGPVSSAALSLDGMRVVTASESGTVRLWPADGSRESLVLGGHGRSFRSAAFSPDQRWVLTGSTDGTARIWDARSGQEIISLREDEAVVLSAAFSPNGQQVLTGSVDGTARIWDAASGQLLHTLEGHDGPILSVTFSPDGTRVLTASGDGTARVWMLADAPRVVAVAAQRADRVWLVGAGGYATGEIDLRSIRPGDLGFMSLYNSGSRAGRLGDEPPLTADLFDVALRGEAAVVAVGAGGTVLEWTLAARQETAPGTEAVPQAQALAEQVGAANQTRPDQQEVQPLRQQKVRGAGEQQQQQQQLQQEQEFQQQVQQVIEPSLAATGWEERKLDAAAGKTLRGVRFADEQHGWIVGDDGLVLETRDGGVSWRKLREDTPGLTLRTIHVQDDGRGWIGGTLPDGRHVIVHSAHALAETPGWKELKQYPAPWVFLLGVPLLLLGGFLNVRAWTFDPLPADSMVGRGTSDRPIGWGDPDPLQFKPLALSLSRFLRNVDTEPPLTLAVTGRWGTGKSSIMNLLQEHLRRYGCRPVWFNAWHHREEEQHLLAALFENIRTQAVPGVLSWSGLVFRSRLLATRTSRTLAWAVIGCLLVALALGVAWLSLSADERQRLPVAVSALFMQQPKAVAEKPKGSEEQAESLHVVLEFVPAFAREPLIALGTAGSLVLLVLWAWRQTRAFPQSAAKLLATLSSHASLRDFRDQLSFRHHFAKAFGEVCHSLRTRTSPGLVILVDDLDRCQPEDVLKILEAVNFCVCAGPCIVVIGMDRRQVEYCVGLGFEKVVEGVPDDELVYALGESRDKAGRQRAFARHYLEKLINIEVPVPTPVDGLAAMLGAMPLGPVAAEPARWGGSLKAGARVAVEFAKIGVLAAALGLPLAWAVQSHLLPWLTRTEAAPVTITPALIDTPADSGPVRAAPTPEAQLTDEPASAIIDLRIPTVTAADIPAARPWLWWGPTLVALAVAGLWGIGAVAKREREVVRDSPVVRKALLDVFPLLTAANPTPRAIKRYRNRMRYQVERLRPEMRESDWLDGLLHAIGSRIGRELVPAAWFEPPAGPRLGETDLSEADLILFGAIEVFAPWAFEAEPDRFRRALEQGLVLGDAGKVIRREKKRAQLWERVRRTFARQIDMEGWPKAKNLAITPASCELAGSPGRRRPTSHLGSGGRPQRGPVPAAPGRGPPN